MDDREEGRQEKAARIDGVRVVRGSVPGSSSRWWRRGNSLGCSDS